MDWRDLLNPEIRDFILENQDIPAHKLALKPMKAGWPRILIADQVKARHKAREKFPGLLGKHPDLIMPPSTLLEQASSEATASYKASLCSKGGSFIDLTAGTGLDSIFLACKFASGICLERDMNTAGILEQNLGTLGIKNLRVANEDAETFCARTDAADLVYLDPQRRTAQAKGLKHFSDCSPSLDIILPALGGKAGKILIKASPMLDITQAVNELQAGNPFRAESVHVVEVRGECREVLYMLSQIPSRDIPITAVSLDEHGEILHKMTFTREEEQQAEAGISPPRDFLYEPGPAFLKAGGYKLLAEKFGVSKLHPLTHLYTSAERKPDFPGRCFRIMDVIPASAKDLPLRKANLAVRNYPSSVESLRKKYKLAEGGDDYMFACTLHDNSRAFIHGLKT